jgi:exopolysaccharide biosynthesis polyprenyl glycosylphosphotransferase
MWLLAVILISGSRLVAGAIQSWQRRRGIGVDRVLIVGAGQVGRAVMQGIVSRPELGYQLVGFVDDDPDKQEDLGRARALGPTSNVARIVEGERIDEVIITLPWMSHRKVLDIMEHCQRKNVSFRIVPDLFQLSLSQVDIDDLDGIPLIGIKTVSISAAARLVKRAMDIVGAALFLVVLSPLLAAIAILIKIDSPGPAFFRQTRVGRGGKEFTVYKFRTMRMHAEEELPQLAGLNEVKGITFKMREDPRRTRLGVFLRRWSIDEFPQFYNVLRGDMSLIGPRPPIPSEVARYEDWHMKRLEVSPGITGLWQVMGRSDLPFAEMVMMDIYYIENWSLALDLKIMALTIPTILSGRGAY